jgi:phage gp29-like protein
MRTITTSKGVTIELDGELLSVFEALFKTMWDADTERSYEHTVQEIQHLLGQLTEAECRQYLAEALFFSFTSYENGRLGSVMKKLDTPEP